MKYGSNRLKEIKKVLQSQIAFIYGNDEASAIMNILIEHFFGLSKVDQALNPDYRLSESEMLKLHFAVKEVLQHKPVQYITGKAEFAGLSLVVDKSVLIPRPETEELVATIIKREKETYSGKILDIGTGSGCIALALKNAFPEAKVTGIDISEKALETARKNARKNKLAVEFFKVDILDEKQWSKQGKFDLIVSNPPYVTEHDKKRMKPNVIDYEPHGALFVTDKNPLLFYEAIITFAKNRLTENGTLYFEINETFHSEILNLLSKSEFVNVEILKDFNGKYRFAIAKMGSNTL